MLQDWVLSVCFFLMTFAVTLMACAWVMRVGVVDAPDGVRKTQARPVPRLGGVAILSGGLLGSALSIILVVFANAPDPIAALIDLPHQMSQDLEGWGWVHGFALIAFLIGFWDDLLTANTKLKLTGLTLACLAAATLGLTPDTFRTPWGSIDAPLFLIIGSAMWLIVFTNAANFMDGSNGMAIGCLAIMLIAIAIIAGVTGTIALTFWWFPLIAAIAGFLMHNLRGHLYAGDAGALGLGALFAGIALASGLEVWTVATLALPFLLDVLLTLVWRAKHGRNWLEAHLDHAYQRLISSGWSHMETAVLYWGLTGTAGVLAYIGAGAGGDAPFAVFWTLALAGSVIWIVHRRATKRDHGIN